MTDAPHRILVRCPNPVGDAVMATPALRALRRAHPAAEIAVLGAAHNGALLRGVESFDAFIPLRDKGLADMLKSVRALRARGFD